jgi:hypothetical protein
MVSNFIGALTTKTSSSRRCLSQTYGSLYRMMASDKKARRPMRQGQAWRILAIGLALIAAALSCGSANRLTAPPGLASAPADPAWCDQDGDGFCPEPIWSDCNDNDPLIHPGAEEQADFVDSNCNGFGDEPPIGFKRQDYSMQGAGSAAEWYGDYVYLAAASVLQIYYAPPGAEPTRLENEIEFRDWVREMAVDGDTLFVAARGDGLYAFDLGQDPAHPTLAGHVSGRFDAGGYTGVEAVFNGVHARGGRVAVARANGVTKGHGGVDAIVFDYDAPSDSFTPVRVIGTEARSNTVAENPVTVALTEDGSGLYIGYGVLLVGELAYLTVDDPAAPVLHGDFGAIMDIETISDKAFVAITGLDWPGVDVGMLSRVSIVGGELVEEPIVTNPGSGAGMAVDIHEDLLCFATWSPGRYEGGYNLWTYTDLLADTPTRIGAAGTLDWVYQLACRHPETGPDWVYVADEWGGLEMWQSDRAALTDTLTLDLDRHRFATGAVAMDLWNDGARIYSAKEGAGLWFFDESTPHAEQVAVEWIDRSDPGCSCADCCPPEHGAWPYPPAVFVTAGASNQGRVALFTHDRNTAVGGHGYFMVFEEEGGNGGYECVYSEPITASAWGGNTVAAEGETLFVSSSTPTLRLYQHCPEETESVRFLAEIAMPPQGSDMEITDVAVYGDYLFVAEVHDAALAAPDSGTIYVYRLKEAGDLARCPDQPSLLPPQAPLGSFGGDLIPRRLVVDPARNRLMVGATTKPIFPIVEGGLWLYDLNSFDPSSVADMDNHRTDITPDESIRVTHSSVFDVLLNGDSLYMVDGDNGLYRYSLSLETYVGFYPAQRGTEAQGFEPQLVLSPPGIIPLHYPVAVALSPAGNVIVQEHVSSRASILRAESAWVYLPLISK